MFGGLVLVCGMGRCHQVLCRFIVGYSGGHLYLCFPTRLGQVWVFVMPNGL